MRKKVLLTGLFLAVAISMTACGGAKKKEPETGNVEQEAVQQETAQQTEAALAEDEMEEESEVFYSAEEICSIYYDYLTGVLSDDEFAELLASMSEGVTVERAKEIFEESGEMFGYVVCEPAPEILNARVDESMIQAGNAVVQFPCTFGEFMETVNGEFADKDEAASADRAMAYRRREYSLDTDFQTLETLGDQGDALVKTPDGSFLLLWLGEDNGEIQPAGDLYITRIISGSPNVFLPGGIHTGLSMQEMDEILAEIEGEFATEGWKTSQSRPDLYNQLSNSANGRSFYFQIDAETNQLWYMETLIAPLAE